ncbi:molybdotransferase-like divisome protein Glp [Millisia brevis]|uniref:molybdotransferase-like divisome protein Glp n=1 Tax=Millisia brevis TaxID=264148 RepID=UPI00082ED215|nr:gephyrin-like molybdotransferase Glp [Millisia brevis]
MRSIEEHRSRILESAVAPRPIRVAISEAHGLMCAEDVSATSALPGFDQAAVDGYAVRSVDLVPPSDDDEAAGDTAAPAAVTLPVVGDVAAGTRRPTRLRPQQCVRISTGAALPTLADAVLPLDHAVGGPDRIEIKTGVRSGDFVRRIGADVQPGDVAVRAGTIIGAAQVGLLAAVGYDKVMVHPRPRVSVLSVGAELVDIDRSPGHAQIFDVNSYALAAAAGEAGAEVSRIGIVPDDPQGVREVVDGCLARSEVVIISCAVGGASVDRLREAMRDLGDLDVERIAMHPGSVQGFGALGPDRVPTFLLPANPVSALVIFELMIRPLIRTALGRRQVLRRVITARSVEEISSPAGRWSFVRGSLMRTEDGRGYLVEPVRVVGTSPYPMVALAGANCLAMIEPAATRVFPGDEVKVLFLAQR